MTDEEEFLLFFARLQADTATTLIDTYRRYQSGDLSITNLTAAFTRTLTGAHTQAAHLGRRLAGVTDPVDPTDAAFAAIVLLEQAPYLRNLISDILGGRYPAGDGGSANVQLLQRLRFYANRLLGTLNATWRMAQPDGTMLEWVLGVPETVHCETCPQRAADGPHDAHTVEFDPGDGSSECGVMCLCHWEVVGGSSGP